MTDTADFLLVESQGPWSGPNATRFLTDAVAVAGAGHRVCVFLAQDAVLAAVPGATPALARLAELGARVWVDDFSVAQRALDPARLSPHVTVADMGRVARLLLSDGCRVVWH